ncbi:hypothetical protein EDB19DRAFT_1911849 [Suillus lakei]|nr:hypothetical protein EDB19DRAFT_1911849 [Suillus lakei]
MSLACISVRPLVISHVSHSEERRTLPPMRSDHPKLRTLRRCTSLEWVYDTDAHSDSSIVEGRLVIRVGDDVAIFPLDERAVPLNDGSLPTMSYWYGKVLGIYLKTAKKTQVTETIILVPIQYDYSCGVRKDVWLDIQWYYRRVDLEDQDVDLAACVGEYELLLSDHKSVVDMHCVEAHAKIVQYDEGNLSQPQIQTATLYHWWNISMQFTMHRNVPQLQQVNIEVCLHELQLQLM